VWGRVFPIGEEVWGGGLCVPFPEIVWIFWCEMMCFGAFWHYFV